LSPHDPAPSRTPVVLGLTGASGALYGKQLLLALLERRHPVELIASTAAQRVFLHELDLAVAPQAMDLWLPVEHRSLVRWHPIDDIGASVASGSYPVQGMVIAPCSMGSVARIATGISHNLLDRAADVQLKERRPLVLVVREAPLSRLHLLNLLKLAEMGAIILPASPGFYHKPRTIDELVRSVIERALTHLGLPESDQRVHWTGE